MPNHTDLSARLFPAPLIAGRLSKRYKRFLADVQLDSGELITAHCANTGAMTGCASVGGRVWLSLSHNPKRKLAHSWELSETAQGAMICVNTARANAIAALAIAQQQIAALTGYATLSQEVPYGAERSRIDLLLTDPARPRCYVEVKSVTLLTDASQGTGAFPDAVTARGAKHLRELMAVAAAGERAVLLFMVLHTGIHQVQPADDIDPTYGQLLRQAAQAGVEVLAVRVPLDAQGWARTASGEYAPLQTIPVHLA
ncbi:MAG: DNA/RNA nuclease SfsA [Aeromonas sp.]